MDRISGMLLNTDTAEIGMLQVLLRLLCAMLVGLIIGLEREYTNRPAGMRTHILVALGSCTVMVIGQLIFVQYTPFGGAPDPARLAAQVITGVGFLGAGTIMREGVNVKGLTTAASLWAVACLGIAAGAGYYFVALLGMIFVFITLTLLEVIQNKLVSSHGGHCKYIIDVAEITDGLRIINGLAKDYRVEISDLLAEKTENGYRITLTAETSGMGNTKRKLDFFTKLASNDKVISVRENTAQSPDSDGKSLGLE